MTPEHRQRERWPTHPFQLVGGDALLISSGTTTSGLLRLRQGVVYPGFPAPSAQGVRLELQPIDAGQLAAAEAESDHEGRRWLADQIRAEQGLPPCTETPSAAHVLELMLELHQRCSEQLNALLASHEPLNRQSEERLFRAMELDEAPATAAQQPNSDDPLLRGLLWLCPGIALPPSAPTAQRLDPRQRLLDLLERSDLFGREVLINDSDLEQDCGDLIGFEDSPHSDVVVLRSTAQGYQLWIPARMARPMPLAQSRDELSNLSPRMLSISPGLQQRDLSALGLLRFAYGEPRQTGLYVISGLLIGVSLGFLLAIGRDVGAARWIFGMGATGALTGTCLGLLSGGFRIGVAVMLLTTLLGLLTPTFNTVITNQALPDRDLGLLLQISGILVAAGVLRVCLQWAQSRALLLSQQRGATRSQLAAMHRLLRLPAEFFRQRNVGDLQLRFGALEELRTEIQQLLEGGLLQSVLTSLYILFMLRISVKLTALALVVAGLLLIPTAIIGIQSRPLQRHQEVAEAQAQSRNLELLNAVSKLRLAGAETRAARWWGEQFQTVVNLENALDAKEATASLLGSIIPNLGTLMVYVVVTRLIAEASSSPALNAPNVGELLGFFSAFGTFIGTAASFSELLIGALDMPVIYERAAPILTTPTESKSQLLAAPALTGEIKLDRVSYRYAPELPLVLDQVSFSVAPGEQVAVVGPSGSGKSTLVRLLLGFDQPENGEIRFDGQPLNGLRLDSVRRQIGTVLQSNALFSGSLIEAIAGGRVINEAEAWRAAELAGLADDIHAMPMGLQTTVTDGGGTLSGGQRQRVAIARALVRKPRILIFDEATSALDNHTQAIVTESLANLDVTRIVIAHRLSTIRNADRIVVIDRGQVREQGSCDSLMNQQGLFFRMMERQLT